MKANEFEQFRLVGGTSLSLQFGHRLSVDIDLFTDAVYGSVDFKKLTKFLKDNFAYVSTSKHELIGMGTSYLIGNNENDCVKLDVYYTDTFIKQILVVDGVRMATAEEIIAMKLEVIVHGGRKKDFWDIHELSMQYSVEQMLKLHKHRYPNGASRKDVLKMLTDFSKADDDFDPICLQNKQWQLIKLDIIEWSRKK